MDAEPEIFSAILDGTLPPDKIKAALVEMADRGETAEEIAAAARAMRARMVTADAPPNAIDVCGTGGDGQHSLNVSTAVAIVVAACDIPMAKHGNRAASSKAGAADTLEALGLDLAKAGNGAERTLKDIGIGFFFAQNHHPALGPLAPIRKEIGRRTIFNLLGPLCNPCGVKRQLIGVASPDLVDKYAKAMGLLGYDKALVVSGEEGLDEISIAGPTKAAWIKRRSSQDRSPEPTASQSKVEGRFETGKRASTSSALRSDSKIENITITPENAGLTRAPLDAIRGGDADYNAAALRALLAGEKGAYRDAVLLNAAAALMVAGEVENLRDGAEEAAEAIDKGLAKALLDCWIANQ